MLCVQFLLGLVIAVYGSKGEKSGAPDRDSGPPPNRAEGKSAPVTRDASAISVECNSQFQPVADCLVEAFKQNEARIEVQFEKKKPKLEACFADNECAFPSADKRKNDSAVQKKFQCRKAVTEKAISFVEDCVKQKFPDLKIPDIRLNFSLPHRFHPEQVCRILNQSCPVDSNRDNVTACFHEVFARDKKSLKSDFGKFCGDGQKCLRQLSKTCRDQFFDVKEQAEKCIVDAFEANLTAGVPECHGSDQYPAARAQCDFGERGFRPHPSHNIKGQGPKSGGIRSDKSEKGQRRGPAGSDQHGPSGPGQRGPPGLPHLGPLGARGPKNKFNVCGDFHEHCRKNFGYGHERDD